MQAFIFDLDGTLLNTLADLGNACNAVLLAHGYAVHPVQAYRQMVGNGFKMLMRRALPSDVSFDEDSLAALTAEGKEYYDAHMMDETAPYPGIMEALDGLCRAGAVLAVLSNKPDDASQVLIKHFFPHIPFAVIQGALPDVPLKPDPSGLLACMKRIGAAKGRSFYVGDSNVDVETARNAGMASIGVAWGFRGEKELAQAGASHIIQSPAELTAFLAKC